MFVVYTFYGLCLFLMIEYSQTSKGCIPRKYDQDSVVCVCNSTYCDETPHLETLPAGHYVAYQSTLEGLRFEKTKGLVLRANRVPIEEQYDLSRYFDPDFIVHGHSYLQIIRNKMYQEVVGFGGSFTDSTGINIASLSKATQDKLLKSYFGNEGIEYNMGRVIIGCSDFSTRIYSYQDFPQDDTQLTNFSLASEDYDYKIKYIKEAEKLTNSKLNLIASSWTAPTWMKRGFSDEEPFRKEYHQTWADYHIRFLDEYDKNNVTFWGITTGNEVFTALYSTDRDSNEWKPKDIGKWIGKNFGPTIRNSKYSNLVIFGLDDMRLFIPFLFTWIFTKAFKYIDAIATHWYFDNRDHMDMNIVHFLLPNKMLLNTESCEGFRYFNIDVLLGNWYRAELHMMSMISYFNHWNAGWIDWNMALNKYGGPKRGANQADSPIIVFPDNDEFVKQPMFYALGHFSKFIPRGSRRIKVKQRWANIDHVAFLRPDGGVVIVFYNPAGIERNVTIEEDNKGIIRIHMKRKSFHTVVYW